MNDLTDVFAIQVDLVLRLLTDADSQGWTGVRNER
jgi:hypothetical protein